VETVTEEINSYTEFYLNFDESISISESLINREAKNFTESMGITESSIRELVLNKSDRIKIKDEVMASPFTTERLHQMTFLRNDSKIANLRTQ